MPRLSRAAAQEREARIVELAEKLFVRNGYDNTTVDQIVSEMRLAKGTYYYHFESKEDLLIAVSEKLIFDTSSKLLAVYSQKDRDIIWRIRNVLKTYQDDFYRNKHIWTHVYHWRNAALYSRVAYTCTKRFTPILEDLLAEAKAAGKIQVPHPHETAESLLVVFDLATRQLCANTDHARRVRIFETLRFLLEQILCKECIPEFAQEKEEEIRRAGVKARRRSGRSIAARP
jgi:AcrR family transcriptional regulator